MFKISDTLYNCRSEGIGRNVCNYTSPQPADLHVLSHVLLLSVKDKTSEIVYETKGNLCTVYLTWPESRSLNPKVINVSAPS